MAIPTAEEIREFLEGYNVTHTILKDSWINLRITKSIVPFVENVIERKVNSIDQHEEYVSGTGKDIVILSKKPIIDLISIEYVYGENYESSIGLAGVEVLKNEGMLKAIANWSEGGYDSVFRKGNKNIKVVYTVGFSDVPDDIHEAIIYLSCEQILGFIGARTGGGSLTVQGFSRNFGDRGKYQDIRNDLKRQGMSLLRKYMTGVIGR